MNVFISNHLTKQNSRKFNIFELNSNPYNRIRTDVFGES